MQAADKLVTSRDAVDKAWPDIFYVWVAKDLILDIQPYVEPDGRGSGDFIEAVRLRIRGIRVGMVHVRCGKV